MPRKSRSHRRSDDKVAAVLAEFVFPDDEWIGAPQECTAQFGDGYGTTSLARLFRASFTQGGKCHVKGMGLSCGSEIACSPWRCKASEVNVKTRHLNRLVRSLPLALAARQLRIERLQPGNRFLSCLASRPPDSA